MGKRHLYQSKHPFDVYAFEAFCDDSWQAVELIRIEDGTMTLHFDDEGTLSAKKGPFSDFRIRSRKATLSDCTCFLRPGIDINALSTPRPMEDSGEEKFCPMWLDAKVSSIERKPHEFKCNCQFFVSFYNTEEGLASENRTLSKEISVLKLDQIKVLQKLQRFPNEKEHFRWKNSNDCSLVHNTKLLLGKFLSDMSCLITVSVMYKVAFDVRSMESKIVYKMIGGTNPNPNLGPNSKELNAVNFKAEEDTMVPFVVPFTPCESVSENIEAEPLPFCDVMDLRRSKRRYVQPERFTNEGAFLDFDDGLVRTMSLVPVNSPNSTDGPRVQTRSSKSKSDQKTRNLRDRNPLAIVPFLTENGGYEEYLEGNCSGEFGDVSINGCLSIRGRKGSDGKGKKEVQRAKGLFRCEKTYGLKYCRKKSSSTSGYNEIFKGYMKKIKLEAKREEQDSIDQWKEIKSMSCFNTKKPDEKRSLKEEEISEVDMLWREMELSIASTYLLEDNNEGSNVVEEASQVKEKACEHEYKLNEQIGILCKFCGFVSTEIRHVLPPMVQPFTVKNPEMETSDNNRNNPKEHGVSRGEDESFEFLRDSARCSESTLSVEKGDNVWALIPHLKDKLQFHQKKAFEFLWRNVAGSLDPSQMQKTSKNRGGCVISHSPGAGKTFLLIAFLLSYLKLFPGKRPLVLAPKTTLYTWFKEIAKWEFPIPVHPIHGCNSYKLDAMDPIIEDCLIDHRKPRKDILHALDCLEKIRKWHSQPSILIMGYTSFLALTRDSDLPHRKYMGEVLQESPGIVVLDEGHNPRSTKSRLRKALMKVKTDVRVLLSGTLFQNNFGEYFNTLSLARPIFIDEVLTNLDSNFKIRKRRGLKQTQFAIENRARKLFIETIAAKIDSKNTDDRLEGLSMLRDMTGNFIDVYEGEGTLENLPGLQCYTLVIKPTQVQNQILLKIQDYMSKCTAFPLELELLTTLGSIHPWLIKTAACVRRFFTDEELEPLDKLKFDLSKGSKVKFVVSLVARSVLKNEKVLIFCHNMAPMNLFLEIFEWFCSWRRNEEILILRGDQDLSERGRVMEIFEDPNGKSKILIASISACAEGISLTAASRVILLDTEWNPAKRKQAVARAFRHGQEKVVYVYQLLVTGVLEESKFGRTSYKEWVSRVIFSKDMAEDPCRWEAETIEDEILREIVEGDCAKSFQIIKKNAKTSNAIFAERKMWH